MVKGRYIRILVFATALAALLPAATQAALFTFEPLTNNTGQPWIVVPQLSVEVTEGTGADAGKVLFTFLNNVGEPSSITDVYFDDGTLLGISSISSSAGVSFANTGAQVLPGHNNVSPSFVTSFSAGATKPGVEHNGVNFASEWLTVKFAASYNDVIDAINLGFTNPSSVDALRVGIHVQGISYATGGGSTSEGYIMTPVPGAAILGLLGLSIVGWKLRKYA